MTEENRAEKAGRAAKTALRRRRERKRVMGWAAATLLGIPLLFGAVWSRLEVSRALGQRDELLARKELLEHSVVRLSGEKTRLATWESLSVRAAHMGLRAPRSSEVVWIDRDGKGRRRR